MSDRVRSDALRQLSERARQDPQFLIRLINDPAAILRDADLNDDERAIVGAANPDQLLSMVGQLRFPTGCGDSQTCAGTCTVTYGLRSASPPEDVPRPPSRRTRR